MRQRVSLSAFLGATLATALLLVAVSPVVAAGTVRAGSDDPIDLNQATAERLTSVPGIGEVMAGRIIQWREDHGPFQRVEDLLKVKGIGDKTFEKLRPYFKVGKPR